MLETIFTFKYLWLVIHVASMSVGVGAATVTDYFFFKFLKDYRISHSESKVLASISKLIWIALSVAIISGSLLFMNDPVGYLSAGKFLVKVGVVTVIVINGFFLGQIVTPQLKKITFHKRHVHEKGELRRLRRISFALGAISITSWYSALVLGLLPKDNPFTFYEIGIAYLTLLLFGILGAQLLEGWYHYKGTKHTK